MFGRNWQEGAVFGRAVQSYNNDREARAKYDLTQGGRVTSAMYNSGVGANPTFRDLFKRTGGKPDRNKYGLVGDPLQEEEGKKTLQAPDSFKTRKANPDRLFNKLRAANKTVPARLGASQSEKQTKEIMSQVGSSGRNEGQMAAVRDEAAFMEVGKIAARERYKALQEKADQDFVNEFVEWLRGRGRKEDYKKAGWDPKIWDPSEPRNRHGRPISEHESVREYLVSHLARKNEYEHKLAEMKLMTGAMSGPHMTLDEAWKYYKYVVRNLPYDEKDAAMYDGDGDDHALRHKARNDVMLEKRGLVGDVYVNKRARAERRAIFEEEAEYRAQEEAERAAQQPEEEEGQDINEIGLDFYSQARLAEAEAEAEEGREIDENAPYTEEQRRAILAEEAEQQRLEAADRAFHEVPEAEEGREIDESYFEVV
jgi:hypothetical protein